MNIHEKPNAASPGALSGVRVLDFSRMLPGPWCTQMLGDFGADVIKVEQPGVGDLGRHNQPNFKEGSVYFNTVNGNKRGITLDLSKPEDRAAAHRLIGQSDVIVESYRRGVPHRLQIDYDTAKRLKPNIIYCSITGFGQTGPFSDIPGHDLVVQSVTGVMGTGLDNEELPPVPGFQAADYAGAAYAIAGVMAALHRKRSTGEGCYLDISMFDSLFSMSNIVSGAALARTGGFPVTTTMEVWGRNPRYSTYKTKDGKAVAVSLLEARIWNSFCKLIGREDLISPDEGPEHRHTVHGNRADLYRKAIGDLCLSKSRDNLVAWMLKNNVPIMPVYSPDEAVQSEHVAARNMVEWMPHPVEGRIPVIANPLASSGLTTGPRGPAPALGQHQDLLSKNEAYPQKRA
jgi:crotonobetainyl-CoA:carnitine CoA-transferase CaiB-like acyl-CoA transferase